MTQMFKRRIVRERVLQILYAFELNSESLQQSTDGLLIDLTDPIDKNFANELVNKVIIHHKDLDMKIKERVDNWEMGRIALIDKLLLRMGICELFYFPDIPPKVSINECIEVAKIYSTAGSGKFINGILDTILAELKKTGKLNKSGRVLIDITLRKPSGSDT